MSGGVYVITCATNGKVYVGSAVNLEKRWRAHRNDLNRRAHHSSYLQRAWDKYGAEAFVFTVLEVVDDKNLLIQAEQKWLDVYESYDGKKGYNICPVAGSALGVRRSEWHKARVGEANRNRSEELRAQISEANRGKHSSDEIRAALSRDWIVTDSDGREYLIHNLAAFCREHGLSNGNMSRVAQGVYKQSKGWKCRPAEEEL